MSEYECEICGFSLGEGSALRSFELHNRVICGRCAQTLPGSAYQEWIREMREVEAV